MVPRSDAKGIASKYPASPSFRQGGALTEHDSTHRWVTSCKICQDVAGLLHLDCEPDGDTAADRGPQRETAGLHHAPAGRARVDEDAHPTTPIQTAAATHDLAEIIDFSTAGTASRSRCRSLHEPGDFLVVVECGLAHHRVDGPRGMLRRARPTLGSGERGVGG